MNSIPTVPHDHSVDPMSDFGRKAVQVLHRLTAPIEILNHLLYLVAHSEDPATVRQYLAEAQEQARIIATAHLELLNAHPGPKPETP